MENPSQMQLRATEMITNHPFLGKKNPFFFFLRKEQSSILQKVVQLFAKEKKKIYNR
jgi:hypothetical protein